LSVFWTFYHNKSAYKTKRKQNIFSTRTYFKILNCRSIKIVFFSASFGNSTEVKWVEKQKQCLEVWGWFHQCFTSSFYMQRSKKRIKHWWLDSLFALLGSARVKAACKHFGEIDLVRTLSTSWSSVTLIISKLWFGLLVTNSNYKICGLVPLPFHNSYVFLTKSTCDSGQGYFGKYFMNIFSVRKCYLQLLFMFVLIGPKAIVKQAARKIMVKKKSYIWNSLSKIFGQA